MTNKSAIKPVRRMARMPAGDAATGADKALPQATASDATAQRPASKISLVIRLLERVEGASLEEMVSATAWLPHTTRAALTGLKQKGKVITKGKRGDVTCYFIAAPVA